MNNTRNKTILHYGFLCLLMIVGTNTGASADTSTEVSATEGKESGYAGLLLGGNSTTNSADNNQTSPIVGLTVGAKITPAFGLGIFGSYYRKTSGSFLGLPAGTSTSTTIITAQGNFFTGGLHLGAEMGPAINSWSGHISSLHASDSTTNMVYGPQAGYDFKITKTLSIGAEAHYLISTGDNDVNNFQAFAAIKGWL